MQKQFEKARVNRYPVREGVSAGMTEDSFWNFGDGQYSDFFEQMFGSGGSRNTKFRGQDYQAELHFRYGMQRKHIARL